MANWQQPFLAFPAMKAKAAEIKHCLRPLLEVWRLHYMSPHSQEDAEVLLLLQRAAEMDELLDQDPTQAVLLYQACLRLCVLGFEYFGLVGRLMKRFVLQGDMAFNVTFKAHWLCHGLLENSLLKSKGRCLLWARRPNANRSPNGECLHPVEESCSHRTEGHAKVCHGIACRLQPDVRFAV